MNTEFYHYRSVLFLTQDVKASVWSELYDYIIHKMNYGRSVNTFE